MLIGGRKLKILCSPNTHDVNRYMKHIHNNQLKILHIVPTLILFQKRAATYRKILRNKSNQLPRFHKLTDQEISKTLSEHNIYLFEMNRLLNFLATQLPEPVLSKKESVIILKRVMEENPITNNTAWSTATKALIETFYYLSIANIPSQALSAFSNNQTWNRVIKLYQSYLQKLKEQNYLDLGLAVKQAIQSDFLNRFHQVYLDGTFLPIQPPLHQLIMRLKKLKKNITFFLPIDLNRIDNPCFEVIIDTYKNYVPINQWNNLNKQNKSKTTHVVQKVAENIFSNQTIQVDDRSIEFCQFPTLEDELNYVVKSIAQKIREGVNPRDIAIVTTNPMELRPMVRELAQLYKLHYPDQEKPLIDMPFGKLILGLFRIHIDERVSILNQNNPYIDTALFAELLYIKLFKQSSQIIPIFEQLKAFFEDCTTFHSWYMKIKQLKQANPLVDDRFHHHPLFGITDQQLEALQSFLNHIEQLSTKLIKHANRTLADHLQVLIRHLEFDQQLIKIDNDTIKRLKEIFIHSSKEKNLMISTKEFAHQIQGILTDDSPNDDFESKDLDTITVTGSNNIEYVQYEYIYLVRFTQQYYPEPIQFNWPLNEKIHYKILKHSTAISGDNKNFLQKYYLNRSLFYLFTVLNSPRKKLIINFAKSYDAKTQTPSHYLNDIAKVFGIEEDPSQSDITIEELLRRYGLLKQPQLKNKTNFSQVAETDNVLPINLKAPISLEELTIYDYCPRRFFYQKLHSNQVIYKNSFQLKKYAQACLYENAIPILVKKFPEITQRVKQKIIQSIDQIVAEAEKKIKTIFPIGERYWEDIRFDTKHYLKFLIENIFSKIKNRGSTIELIAQSEQLAAGRYVFTGQRELQVITDQANHYYYVISNFKDLLSFSTKQMSDSIKRDYFKKIEYMFDKNDKKYFVQYANKISHSSFHKRKGEHCSYCPYIESCLERAIQ